MSDWKEGLGSDLLSTVGKFEDVADLAEGYRKLEKWQGNAMRIPGEDAPEEDWKDFREKLTSRVSGLTYGLPDEPTVEQAALYRQTHGIPEEAGGYQTDVELDKDSLDRIRTLAHETNMTPKQFNKLVDQVKTAADLDAEAQSDQVKADQAALRAKWGESADQRKARVDSFLTEYKDADLPLEGELNAAAYLVFDKMIEGLQGKGPQGHQQHQDIGPDVDELHAQKDELIRKMSSKDYHPSMEERRADQTKFMKILEKINRAA